MKKVYVTLGVFVVLGTLAFVVNYDPTGKGPHRASAKEEAVAALPAIDQARVHGVEISDATSTIRVARVKDQWILPDKSDHPATVQRVTELVQALQGLERAEVVAKSAAAVRDRAFGLEPDTAKRLKLYDETNRVLLDLWVGKPDAGGERALQAAGTFVRLEGRDAVYSHRKRLQHLVMPLLSMWLESRLFVMEPKDLDDAMRKAERVTIEFDDVPFTPGTAVSDTRPEAADAPRVRVVLEAKAAESVPAAPSESVGPTSPVPPRQDAQQPPRTWSIVEPEGSGVAPYGPYVDQIVRSLLYSRADDVAGTDPTLREFGFDRPFVEVEVRFSDGVARRIRFGNQAPAPSEPSRRTGTFRYAHVDGIPRVFLLNEYLLAAFRKKPAELAQPAAGAPGAVPGATAPIDLPKDAPETRK